MKSVQREPDARGRQNLWRFSVGCLSPGRGRGRFTIEPPDCESVPRGLVGSRANLQPLAAMKLQGSMVSRPCIAGEWGDRFSGPQPLRSLHVYPIRANPDA
jgi:hypothetical protein